jgi:hypothetical protein
VLLSPFHYICTHHFARLLRQRHVHHSEVGAS